MKYFLSILCLCASVILSAQEQDEPKTLLDRIDEEVEKYTESLSLEDWQVFYVDSILVHNYTALQEEMMALSKVNVSNADIYVRVQDKWMEANYNAFRAVLTDAQWEKYLKIGASRDKKQRDKRAAKREI